MHWNSPTMLLRGMTTQQNRRNWDLEEELGYSSSHTLYFGITVTWAISVLHSFISRNAVFTCMWFTARTNQNQNTSSLSSLRPTLRWQNHYAKSVLVELWGDLSCFSLKYSFSLTCFPTGSQTAVGSQAAAQWSAHQTCSEDHEVSAIAEGVLFNMTGDVESARFFNEPPPL